jgi:hypothetical protein
MHATVTNHRTFWNGCWIVILIILSHSASPASAQFIVMERNPEDQSEPIPPPETLEQQFMVVERDPEDQDRTTIYRVAVDARSPEPPVMRYRLVPAWNDTTNANAATQYHRAILTISQSMAHVPDQLEFWEKFETWRTMPLDQLPRQEVEQVVQSFSSALREVHFGARRRFCHWDLPIDEQKAELYSILLPEIQEMRTVARILAVRIRLRLAQGDLDGAITDLQTGYSIARHVGHQNFVVSGMVGVAISMLMHEQLLTCMTLENAPNLYWSITNLPNPLIDLRTPIDMEWDNVFVLFPELIQARTEQHSEDEWNRRLSRVAQYTHEFGGPSPLTNSLDVGGILGRVAIFSRVPMIKHALISEMGYDEDTINVMSGSQAILLYAGLAYERIRDELSKPVGLPYHQALPLYHAGEARRADHPSIDPLRLGDNFSPASPQYHLVVTRSQRWIDLLRTVEAIRDYARTHHGLPETLEAVTELPVPPNPLTGEPFHYVVDESNTSRATLVTGGSVRDGPIRIILELRRPDQDSGDKNNTEAGAK